VTLSIRDASDGTSVLAAIPLTDVSCRARAVVAVREMPFVALHAETLELLAVLGGRLGDSIAQLSRAPSRAAVEASGSHEVPSQTPEVVPVPVEEAA
jgi:hypothetical protein